MAKSAESISIAEWHDHLRKKQRGDDKPVVLYVDTDDEESVQSVSIKRKKMSKDEEKADEQADSKQDSKQASKQDLQLDPFTKERLDQFTKCHICLEDDRVDFFLFPVCNHKICVECAKRWFNRKNYLQCTDCNREAVEIESPDQIVPCLPIRELLCLLKPELEQKWQDDRLQRDPQYQFRELVLNPLKLKEVIGISYMYKSSVSADHMEKLLILVRRMYEMELLDRWRHALALIGRGRCTYSNSIVEVTKGHKNQSCFLLQLQGTTLGIYNNANLLDTWDNDFLLNQLIMTPP